MFSGKIADPAKLRTSYLAANSSPSSALNMVNYFGIGTYSPSNSASSHKTQLFASEANQNVYALVCERILVDHDINEHEALSRAAKIVLGAFPAFQGRIVEDTVSLYLERFASVVAEEAASSMSPLAAEEAAAILLKIFRFVRDLRVTEEPHVLRSHLLVARAVRLLVAPCPVSATSSSSTPQASVSQALRKNGRDSGAVEGLGDAAMDISSAAGYFVGSPAKAVSTILSEDIKKELDEVVKEAIQVCLSIAKRRKDLAPALLQPLCAVLPAHRWNDGYELLTVAQGADTYFNLECSDTLLWLMLRAGQHRRVIAAWGWMKHTTAGSSRTVVSAILVALTREHKKFGEIIQLMQHLAQKGKDPTEEAQIAILNSILKTHDPMADYAMQLVCFWTPTTAHHAFRVHFLAFQIAAKARNRNIANTALEFLCYGRKLGVSVPVPSKKAAVPSSSSADTTASNEDGESRGEADIADLSVFMGPADFSAILHHIGNLFSHKIATAASELDVVVVLATRLLETARVSMSGHYSSPDEDGRQAGQTTLARFHDALRLCGCVLALKSFALKLDSSAESTPLPNAIEAKIDSLVAGIADIFVSVLPTVTLIGGHAVPSSAEVFSRTMRYQFASLPSSYWSEGKAASKELAALVPGASIPASAEEWYDLMVSGAAESEGGADAEGSASEEDASSILEELGR